MSRLFFFLALSSTIFSEVKVNDNIIGKLSLFPVIVKNSSNVEPQIWVVWVDNRSPGKSYDIYVNGLTSNMTRWWSDDKVISRNYPGVDIFHGHRLSHTACTDDSGGIFIGYINHHKLDPYKQGIYVYRLRPDGTSPQSKPTFISPSTSGFSLCPDGAGGCVIVALEKDGKTIKAWRLLSDGSFDDNWGGKDGKVIRTGTTVAKNPKVVESKGLDGSISGVIVFWIEQDSTDWWYQYLCARKIDTAGSAMERKIIDYTKSIWQYNPAKYPGYCVVSDDSNGAWITWECIKMKKDSFLDQFRVIESRIYAQRINSSADTLFPRIEIDTRNDYPSSNPVGVDIDSAYHLPPVIASGSSHGSFVCWSENNGSYPNWGTWRLYVQRILSNGSKPSDWEEGKQVSSLYGDQRTSHLLDCGGDCIIVWKQGWNAEADIYEQKLKGIDGTRLWTNEGKIICSASGFQGSPRIIKSDSNHAIIVWDDNRSSWDIYAKRVRLNDGEEE